MAELINVLTASVDVPEEDLAGGVAQRYPSPGAVGRNLQISRSTERPSNASVAVEYRNYWFYIDDSDLESKTTFGILQILLSMAKDSSPSKGPLISIGN